MKKFVSLLLALMMAFTCVAVSEAKPKLVIGTNPEFPPFEYVDDNNTISGFDIDLIDLIMTLLDYEYEVVAMDFDALLPALESGLIHLAIAGMTIDETRKESALFSTPYFNASQKIIVREGSEIKTEADLAGKRIGVQMGTTGDLYVTEHFPDATIVRPNKALDAVMDLKNGKLDAVVTDAEPSKVFAAQYDDLLILDDNLSDEQYGIAASLKSEKLIEEVDEALKYIVENGYFDELYTHWFGEEAEA